jgi:hypothetical protein
VTANATPNGDPSSIAFLLNTTDTTSPLVVPAITGTLGSDGWNTSDVNLSWSVTDAESAIDSQSGCGPVDVTTDQPATGYTCSATSAGASASATVLIKRDATAPVTTVTDDPALLTTDPKATFTFSAARPARPSSARSTPATSRRAPRPTRRRQAPARTCARSIPPTRPRRRASSRS